MGNYDTDDLEICYAGQEAVIKHGDGHKIPQMYHQVQNVNEHEWERTRQQNDLQLANHLEKQTKNSKTGAFWKTDAIPDDDKLLVTMAPVPIIFKLNNLSID